MEPYDTPDSRVIGEKDFPRERAEKNMHDKQFWSQVIKGPESKELLICVLEEHTRIHQRLWLMPDKMDSM
jgi:hypothetical protein